MGMFSNFIKAYRHAKAESNVETTEKKRYTVAFLYNELHFKQFDTNSKWMCPTCNRIHEQNGMNGYHGGNYPRCCGFLDGHRNGKAFATNVKDIGYKLKSWFYQ